MTKTIGLITAVVCFVVLLTAILAGCGKTETASVEEESGEIDFYVFEGGYGRAWEDAVASIFLERTGVKVNVTASPNIGEILRPKMIAGESPDIVSLNWGHQAGILEALFKEDGLEDITDLVNRDSLKGRFLDGFLESERVSPYGDGRVYVAPLFYTGLGMVYNAAYFEANDIEVPKTWGEFFDLGDRVRNIDPDRALFTYQGIYTGYLENMVFPAIAGAGGLEAAKALMNYEEGSVSTPAVKAVLQNLGDIAANGYLMEGTTALNHTDSQAAFMRGDALFHPNGAWVVNEMAEADREDVFSWSVAAPPTLEAGAAQYALAHLSSIWIPKAAKNKADAKDFLEFMYSDESMLLAAELAGAAMPIEGGLDLVMDSLDPSVAGFFTLFSEGVLPMTSSWSPLPDGTKMNPKTEFWDKNIAGLMKGEVSVDELSANMEEVYAQVRQEIQAAGN